MKLDFNGMTDTIRVADSFELGSILFHIAGKREVKPDDFSKQSVETRG